MDRSAEPIEAAEAIKGVERRLLCLVGDLAAMGGSPEAMVECIAAAVRGGVDWVQVRLQGLDGAAWLAIADSVDRAVAGRARVLINGRIDVALAISADGAYLGRGALPLPDVRSLLDSSEMYETRSSLIKRPLLGGSAHQPEEIPALALAGADFAHLAPIFDPLSKAAGSPALGCDALRSAASHGLPILAQGGIDASRVREVIAAGARGIAVTGSVSGAAHPESAARELRQALDDACSGNAGSV